MDATFESKFDCTTSCQSKSCSKTIFQKIAQSETYEDLLNVLNNLCQNPKTKLDHHNRNLLDICCSVGNLEFISELLSPESSIENSPNQINIYNKDLESGYTCFHRCIYYGRISCLIEIFKILNKHEPFLNSKNVLDNENFTPFELLLTMYQEILVKIMENDPKYGKSKRYVPDRWLRAKLIENSKNRHFKNYVISRQKTSKDSPSLSIKMWGTKNENDNILDAKFSNHFQKASLGKYHTVLGKINPKTGHINEIYTIGVGSRRLGTGTGVFWVIFFGDVFICFYHQQKHKNILLI